MDEAFSKPSLVDDPTFLADLDELDRGLIDNPIPGPTRRPLRSSLAAVPAAVATGVPPRSAADVPIVLQPGTRRPLLDLFPPLPTGPEPIPTRLARGTATAPRLAPPSRAIAPAEAAAPRSDETFYGFAEPAFGPEPELRFLYHSVEHDRVVQQIVDAIARRDGLIAVTGPTGIGKTLLCKAIADQLDRRTLTSVVLAPASSFDDLVQTLLVDFGVLSREELAPAADPAEFSKTLRSFLASLASLQANAVIVLDEAHHVAPDLLASLDALAAEMPRTLQIVLVGQPSLTRLLERPELGVVKAHVALRLHHGPLAADEVPGYVMHRVQMTAASPRIDFDDAALAWLFELSQGVPGIVNRLCDRAVTRAFESAASVIDAATIGTAAEDLGIAPPPGTGDAFRAIALGVVFVLLMFVGASASAWMFRDRVHLILMHYGYPSAMSLAVLSIVMRRSDGAPAAANLFRQVRNPERDHQRDCGHERPQHGRTASADGRGNARAALRPGREHLLGT